MLFKIDEVLLLENLTYVADAYPFTSILRAKDKTLEQYLNEIDMEAIDDDVDYASYIVGRQWKQMIYAIKKNANLSKTKIIDTHLDTAYGGGGGISVIYVNEDNKECVVAFRGTANNEWIDDFLGANQVDSLQQINALEWYKMVYDKYDLSKYTITITGHSKGGNKAKYITILNNTVDRCISFDGQGFSDKFMDNYKKEIVLRQNVIENHNIDFDYVNILMNDIGNRTYYVGFDYGRGGFAEAHCPNRFFNFKEDNSYSILVNKDGQRPELKVLNRFINSMIRSAVNDIERSKNNKLVGMLVEKAFSIGTDDNTTANYISYLCDMIGDPKYSENTAYLLTFTIKYSKIDPQFLGALKSIMDYFNAQGIVKVIDMLEELVNSKKLTALLGLSNFLINHVNGIVVKKIQSIAKKKYDVDLSKEQIQRVLQIVCIVRGMMKTLELNMDGSGLTVSEYNEDDEKFELPDNLNIVVLAGGLSNLRNMSINTGYMVKNALKEKGHNVILLDSYMGYDEEEIIIDDPFNDTDKYSLEVNSISEEPVDLWAVKKRRTDQSSSFFGPNVIQICKKADIVFIALHSSSGETGKVQATFDLLDIDYTGCDYFSGAICANKVVTKNILKENNIKAVNSYIVGFDNDIEPINHNMNYPVIIKPNTTVLNTTSIIAYDKEGFLNGIKKALSFKCDVIVEEYIEGRVFSVGILDKKALPVLEILPLNSRSKDPNVRVNGIKASMCPAKIDNDLENKLKDQALKIANILGLKRYSNITFIVNDDIVCYSCDSLPQLDQYSHMAIMAKAAGISFNDFCEKIVELTLINE